MLNTLASGRDVLQLELLAGFHALSDPWRLRILEELRGRERCVCELSEALGVAQSKLSFHLKTLRSAGLIEGRQEGRWMYYRLQPEYFQVLERYLQRLQNSVVLEPAPLCGETEP
ncbi:MAG: metalloregulator ArsR/SmtB family transcription factor [Cyanobacteria bacterium RI_101]|nr:metalloregulator ArsR/SmtB family transcription factor [Cyanobacteria bacterium RI_101]